MSEHAEKGTEKTREHLGLTVKLLVFAALTVAVMGVLWNIRQELDQAKRDNKVLAQQVVALGGVPQVTPQPGPVGPTGSPGTNGVNGLNGRNGNTGQPGPAVTGPAGSQGPAGATVTGPPGVIGPSGAPGKDGKDGADGATGPAGKEGPPPSRWSWTDSLGVTYTCTQTSSGSTTYDCQPSGTSPTAKGK